MSTSGMTCPRCYGPMLSERDHNGPYRTCLCCGWVSYLEPPEDYIPDRGRRKGERSRRNPYHKQRNSRRGVLESR